MDLPGLVEELYQQQKLLKVLEFKQQQLLVVEQLHLTQLQEQQQKTIMEVVGHLLVH
jgi:hypothetical protein